MYYDAHVQKCNFVGVSFLDLLDPDLGPYIYIYIYHCKKGNCQFNKPLAVLMSKHVTRMDS